ncbi:hypothetical protein MSAS_55240 [Mycobacterium saskatchewanense]|uniref:EAL domain-containing protein n=1 Tax=Mycobacterium saskatchewanense TaxID=220927 RepID=A0AAJ3NPB1_9MYCO|nr:EAL domain-containing protein [Mycobacterium saskatchewanense]ORW70746.1 hypothetical protein AWC23_16025 [Mycobacterium saskatchewanense]BBX66350.1 hypothetical protein MSAS_55240 [Mycobacterium saskatchewanense]
MNAIRRRGWVIAFDDAGVNSASLPLLDVLRPEIVKLDMNLVRSTPRAHASQVMSAALTYRERRNAVILAEGVETGDQRVRSRLRHAVTCVTIIASHLLARIT